MANTNVDRYGNPISGPYQVIIGSDGVPLQQRGVLLLDASITATDNPDLGATELAATISGTVTAAGAAMISAATAVAQAGLLGQTIPTAGTNVPDANTTIALNGGAHYVMPTRTAARVITLGTTSAVENEIIILDVTGTGAFAVTVQDDAATLLFTVPASTKMTVVAKFDGTHFANPVAVRIQ